MTPRELFASHLARPWTTAGDDVQYCLAREGATVRLDFQGSASRRDWWNNFDFATTPYKDQPQPWKAHRGFVRMWKSVRDRVMAELKAITMPGDTILVVGYSQGAALGTLAYEDIRWQMPDIHVEARLFGSPRVLWMPSEMIQMRFPTLYRHSARGDIVTMVPPSWIGYSHVGHESPCGPKRWPTIKAHYPEYYLANMDT